MMMTRTQSTNSRVRHNKRVSSSLVLLLRFFCLFVRRAREEHKDDDDVFVSSSSSSSSRKRFWVRTKTERTSGQRDDKTPTEFVWELLRIQKKREGQKRTHEISTTNEVNLSKGQNSAGVRRSTRKGHEREQKYVESKSVLKNTTTSTRAWFFITADDGSKICFERAGLARRTLVNPSLEEVRGLEQRASTVVVVVVVVVEAARRKSLTPRSFLR